MRNIDYVVSVSYCKFHFNSIVYAAKFAEEAIQHIDKEDRSVSIDLNIIDNEEESDAETEEA